MRKLNVQSIIAIATALLGIGALYGKITAQAEEVSKVTTRVENLEKTIHQQLELLARIDERQKRLEQFLTK